MNKLLKHPLKPLVHALVACLALSATHSAHAVASQCAYKVTKVSFNFAGWVYASFASPSGPMLLDYMLLCNVDSASGGISATTCKSMVATLLTAKASQSTVMMWFDQPTAFSCSTTLSWANLGQSTGWYFGPSIE